ncbi:MAG: YceI family protein [Pseudomonadota bacterium]|nr:YceI family protein [Pseudomonadota bacterium]
MHCINRLMAGALCLGVVGAAQAADRFVIDPEHTNIVFWVDHLGYSKMVGQFQEFSGEFVIDQEKPENGSVEITIDTSSVDTDQDKRDEHLRSPDFFNAGEFPEMTFKSTKVESAGDNAYKVTGDLTLLGTTKPVVLDMTVNKVAPNPLPNSGGVLTAGLSGRTTIKRSEFGMTTFTPNLGDEIDIWLEVEGKKKEGG